MECPHFRSWKRKYSLTYYPWKCPFHFHKQASQSKKKRKKPVFVDSLLYSWHRHSVNILDSIMLKNGYLIIAHGFFCACMCVQLISCVWLFEIPWTVAHQAPLSMGFSRQEYWSGLPCPPPGDLPNAEIEPRS